MPDQAKLCLARGQIHRTGSKFDGTRVAEGGVTMERRPAIGGVDDFDAAGVLPAPTKTPRTGEHRLALSLVSDAVAESFGEPSTRRSEARAWLRATSIPLLSAKTCFEALDFEYAAVMAKLEARWRGMGV